MRPQLAVGLLSMCVVFGPLACATARRDTPGAGTDAMGQRPTSSQASEAAAPTAADTAAAAPVRPAPLFSGMGTHHHPITTDSEQTQRYFDQGLVLTYGFNHAEAVRSYRAGIENDPECAMCYWGIAYALGPNINAPMPPEHGPQAWEALQKARALAPAASAKEQAYIAALSKRYTAENPTDRAALDAAYADAMGGVARTYPDDLDAVTLAAEARMDTMPWDYYEKDGSPKPATKDVTAAIESVLAREPDHVGAIHYYIHLVEPSSTPERAEAPADRLVKLAPASGHLVHMPSHIYFLVGRYEDSSTVNEQAAAADESYIAQCRAQGFYPALYYPHNVHMLYASASEEGRSQAAIDAAKRLMAASPDENFETYPMLQEFRPVYLFALARFGRWDEILAAPAPSAHLRYSTGVWHYARGMAFAARDRTGEAASEYDVLRTIAREPGMADLRLLSGSTPRDLLAIAERVLGAEMARARERGDEEVQLLREAVRIQDALPYTEPPPWYFPVRNALGAALLRAGRNDEAELVFREALHRRPRNGWALYGLAESLRAQGEEAAAAEAEREFREAWARADVTPTAFFR